MPATTENLEADKENIQPNQQVNTQPTRVLRPRFFTTPIDGKKDFERRFNNAMSLIEHNQSEIAKQVLECIKTKQVKINSFYDLTQKEFAAVKKDFVDKANHHIFTYPPNKATVTLIESTLDGLCFDYGTIYVRSTLNRYKLAKTIIHEVTHHLTNPQYVQDLKTMPELKAMYISETKSHRAEKIFIKNGVELTAKEKRKVSSKIANRYPEFENLDVKKIRI